jgi:hypothetical protein
MRMSLWLPGAYVALALYVWIDFTQTNPDGLANIGLMVVVLPITILGLLAGWALGEESFILLPDGFGYVGDHALFYFPSVTVVAALLWCLGASVDRRRAAARRGSGTRE